jgi:hypothetical protein
MNVEKKLAVSEKKYFLAIDKEEKSIIAINFLKKEIVILLI